MGNTMGLDCLNSRKSFALKALTSSVQVCVPKLQKNDASEDVVEFGDVYLTVLDIKALCDALCKNKVVRTVRFNIGTPNQDVAASLRKMLKENTSIKALHLQNFSVGVQEALQLAGGLKSNETVEDLGIRESKVTDAILKEYLDVLVERSVLTTINLAGNVIEDEGALLLAKSIGQLTGLHDVDVADNRIGDEGILKLAECLEEGLNVLNVSGNAVGDEGRKKLKQVAFRLAAGDSTKQLLA